MSFWEKLISFFRLRGKARQEEPAAIVPFPEERDADKSKKPAGLARVPPPSASAKTRNLSYWVTTGQKRDWLVPQVDHYEVEALYDVEAYFARATRAKLALFLREGYEFVGRNYERVDYIRARFTQMERAGGLPLTLLLYHVCRDLIVHSNAYLLKVRKTEASGGRERMVDGRLLRPVAAYFPLPPETMTPEIDSSNNILRWRQEIGDEERIFQKWDIVHFCTNRKAGYPLGVPSILPLKDDVRALRDIEANLEVLLHKYLHPIVLWRVGTPEVPAQIYSDGTTEVDEVKEKVMNMPAEGNLVVTERHNVDVVGLEGEAIRVEPYLQHYKNRLLAGLDVSSVDVGEGNTSSRATALTLSRNLMDTVKLHQTVVEKVFSSIITELLLESTFPQGTVLSPENMVALKFREIDKDAKTKEDNHLTDLFLKNVITYDELRTGVGMEPLPPEEERNLYWYKFGREEALIRAIDESPTSFGEGSVSSKNNPENQHGKRGGPKMQREALFDSYASSNNHANPILRWHDTIRDEMHARWAAGQLDLRLAKTDIELAYETALSEFLAYLRSIVRNAFPVPEEAAVLFGPLERRARRYVRRLSEDVIDRLSDRVDPPNVVFNALRFRAVMIHDTEGHRAFNIARYRWLRRHDVDVDVWQAEDVCEECRRAADRMRRAERLYQELLPPFHPVCRCLVVERT